MEKETVLNKYKDKLYHIIASCEDGAQLTNTWMWIQSLQQKGDGIRVLLFKAAVTSRYYRMIQEFNTLKAQSRNETIEEYTEGRQKFYCDNVRRKNDG